MLHASSKPHKSLGSLRNEFQEAALSLYDEMLLLVLVRRGCQLQFWCFCVAARHVCCSNDASSERPQDRSRGE